MRKFPLHAHAAKALQTGQGAVVKHGTTSWLLVPFLQAPHLIIIGAVHITQYLCPIAAMMEYQITIIDPRPAFAQRNIFNGNKVLCAWPDDVLSSQDITANTAVVVLTHDEKIDDPALHISLQSKCFYLGALGSLKTQAARAERLRHAGFSKENIARLCGPIGLDIGAKSPAEIALAIMAEILQKRSS